MPWAPGTNMSGLFNLYPSLGDVTLTADLATTLDGPMQVFRFGALTINTSRTVTNRCRGAVILCDSLTMGATGYLSMTGKGAAGSPKWVNQDIIVPSSALFSGRYADKAAFFSYLAATGYFAFDPTLMACPPPGMGDTIADYTSWPGRGTSIISAAGCGAGTSYVYAGHFVDDTSYSEPGYAGNAGSFAPGGGGGGGFSVTQAGSYSGAYGGQGGAACVWSGGDCGIGSSATNYISKAGANALNFGAGYGAPGGVLIIIVRNNVTLTSGHVISANGVIYPVSYCGGPGGGFAGLFYGGTLTGTPSIVASAAATAGGGGNGGQGAVRVASFATMGW